MAAKFKTMHRAWYALGLRKDEMLTFGRLESVVLKHGYGGDTHALWQSLDSKQVRTLFIAAGPGISTVNMAKIESIG